MATKSRPMKTLRQESILSWLRYFQKRKYETPPTIIGQHATRGPLHAALIQDFIFSPSTNPQEGAAPEDSMHDQGDVVTDAYFRERRGSGLSWHRWIAF